MNNDLKILSATLILAMVISVFYAAVFDLMAGFLIFAVVSIPAIVLTAVIVSEKKRLTK